MPQAGSPYRWFAAGVATWFAAWGAQSVLFSWLVVGVLESDPSRVGVAQMATMLPSVFLVLVGGATADRSHDRRAILLRLHFVAAAFALVLLAVVASGALAYWMLMVYGLAIGTVSAFVVPTRDALLSEVAGDDMMRAVSGLILAQWGSQAFGSLAGSSARFIGTTGALAIPAGLFLVGVPLLLQLPRPAPRPVVAPADVVKRNTSREIGEGLRIVLHSPVLRPTLMLVIAVGLLFIGPFSVVMPLLVRNVYGGGVGELGLLLMIFPVGTILGSGLLILRGGVRSKGRAQILGLAWGAVALGTIALGLPFAGALVAICAWGFGAAIFMSSSRTLFQEEAPMSHRGRVLSVFSLGFMGSGPLGALFSGFLVGHFGELAACGVSAAAMLAVALFAALFSGVWRVE